MRFPTLAFSFGGLVAVAAAARDGMAKVARAHNAWEFPTGNDLNPRAANGWSVQAPSGMKDGDCGPFQFTFYTPQSVEVDPQKYTDQQMYIIAKQRIKLIDSKSTYIKPYMNAVSQYQDVENYFFKKTAVFTPDPEMLLTSDTWLEMNFWIDRDSGDANATDSSASFRVPVCTK
ncbi:hypothetical protein T439DRAFT_382021 [Meredithblackwellia eburnea MCA 4105]